MKSLKNTTLHSQKHMMCVSESGRNRGRYCVAGDPASTLQL